MQAEANRFSLALMSIKQDREREGRTCKILEVEVKELRGEPQASTRGLTGVQCGRGEGCNAMSQQNLEEEAGCGQADCRKMKKQAMAKRTADKDRQWPSDRTAEKTLEILLSQAHTHHVVVLSSCHIALL